jgi:hypothetical protein
VGMEEANTSHLRNTASREHKCLLKCHHGASKSSSHPRPHLHGDDASQQQMQRGAEGRRPAHSGPTAATPRRVALATGSRSQDRSALAARAEAGQSRPPACGPAPRTSRPRPTARRQAACRRPAPAVTGTRQPQSRCHRKPVAAPQSSAKVTSVVARPSITIPSKNRQHLQLEMAMGTRNPST